MDNNDTYNRSTKFNDFSLSPFAIMKSMALWQQQSAIAWMETYKEFVAYSNKISESYSDVLWKMWTGKRNSSKRKCITTEAYPQY
jgi:hypothetical protein